MDTINQILYINLAHRIDRKDKILKTLKLIDVDENKIQRVEATLFELCGHIGCGQSHVNALDIAIKNNWNTVMILEDDFVFTQTKEYIDEIIKNLPSDYDLVMMHGLNNKTKKININGVHKLNYCISSGGYIIKRHYFQKLKDVFTEAISNMYKLFNQYVEEQKLKGRKIIPKMIWNKYAIDRSWHGMMKTDNFYLCVPHLGKQDDSYSDNMCTVNKQNIIIKKNVIVSQPAINKIEYKPDMSKIYIPSIDLLKKLIDKKNQTSKKYKFMIILRQHQDEIKIIDQLISVLLAHYDNDIFIGISKSNNSKISKQLETICDYIKFTDSFDVSSKLADFNLVVHGIKYFKHIDAKYILWHSASEYYCRKMNKDFEINYVKKSNNQIVKYSKDQMNEIINKLPSNWMWWSYLKKNEKIVKYFVDNEIVPCHDQVNGLCIRKDIMFECLETIKPYEPIPMICFQEMLPLSYLNKYYDYDKFCITNIFWACQNSVVKKHTENIKNNKVNYYAMKRIDQNNGLLDYLHNNFIKTELVKLELF